MITLRFPVRVFHAIPEFGSHSHEHKTTLGITLDPDGSDTPELDSAVTAELPSGPLFSVIPQYRSGERPDTETLIVAIREHVFFGSKAPMFTFGPKTEDIARFDAHQVRMEHAIFENIAIYFAKQVDDAVKSEKVDFVCLSLTVEYGDGVSGIYLVDAPIN